MTKKALIVRIFNYLKKDKILLFLSLLMTVIYVCISLAIPIIAGKAIDGIEAGSDIFSSQIVIMFLASLSSAVLQYAVSNINYGLIYNFLFKIRSEAYRKIVNMNISFFDRNSNGDVLSRIISDTEQATDGLLMGFSNLISGIVTIVITLVFMFCINTMIALTVVILSPLSVIISSFIAGKTFSFYKKQTETKGKEASLTNEIINNISTIKSYSFESQITDEFSDTNDEYVNASIKAIFYSSLVNPTTRFVNSTIYAFVVYIGSVFCLNGSISIGMLSAFLSYSTQYTKPFNEISGVFAELQNSMACASRMFYLIDEQNTVSKRGMNETIIDTSVEFKEVFFSYDKRTHVINGISLYVPSGKRIALVGKTGCGKTTLINLLMNFYDIECGKIFVGGYDIGSLSQETLCSNVGFVFQNSWLMNGTIRENLCIGNDRVTEEEMTEAAKKTCCHNIIMKMEKGYDTVISDKINSLSKGEKQLLCICRAMISKPKILILDEATSEIDSRTESLVQNAMNILLENKTAIIIAHRLSTVTSCDSIYVMKNGTIAESGTHEELINKKGLYYEMYFGMKDGV